MKLVTKTFKIDEQVVKQLEEIGMKEGLAFSSIVRKLIYQHINNLREKTPMK